MFEGTGLNPANLTMAIQKHSMLTHESDSRGRDNAVCIVTGYVQDDPGLGVRVPVRYRLFSSPQLPDLLTSSHPMALSPGVKRPGREADRSPPASAEVKKTWVFACFPPYILMA
jgi:hypothetical protein